MKKKTLIIIALIISQFVWAQKQQDSTAYSFDFQFNDGLLLSFKDLKSNTALPFRNIITKYDYRKGDFLKLLLKEKEIRFFKDGKKQLIPISEVWGYVNKSHIYIQFNKKFYRVPAVGSISFFMAKIEVEYQRSMDNWNMGMYGGFAGTESYKSEKLMQFLVDFTDGTIYDYSIQNIENLISGNKTIYDAFNSLRKRQKRKNAFMYIKKYNDATPWYIYKN